LILVDSNLLVYARVSDFSQHEAARTWLDEQLNGITGVGLPWPSLLGFIRLVCNRRIFERPLSIEEAWRQVEEWLDCRPSWVPEPTDRHREVMRTLMPAVGNRPNLIPDAHLAALAIEHGLMLCSTDGDFARFDGLRWQNPLATSRRT
jgi:toxin-antitoxin system PIN domain toxin